MKNIELDFSKLDSLSEFINFLKYNDLENTEIIDITIQAPMIKHLSTLLSANNQIDHGMDHDLFIFPGNEQFLTRLFEKLDSSLEPQAKDLYLNGSAYIAGFMGTHQAQYVMRRLLKILATRFPKIQAMHDEQLDDFINAFFKPTISEFLNENCEALKNFTKEFPIVNDLFINPLTNESSKYKERKLHNYYCNPWIYSPIIDHLVNQDHRHTPMKNYIKWFEEVLYAIKPRTNKASWDELVNKSHDLHNTSQDLESFANACSGLLGEIKAAHHLIQHKCKQEDILIFLAEDSQNGKKLKKKNCDLLVMSAINQKRSLTEVKTKSPRHGVDEIDIAYWDDFFSNFSDSISSYLFYLEPRVSPICNLSLRKSFPLFCAFEGSSYGSALSTTAILKSQDKMNIKYINEDKSQNKIETMLRALYLKPLILYPALVPLDPEDQRLAKRLQSTENVILKEWVRNTIENGVKQLQESYKRQISEGHTVSKLYFALNLSLSYRLLQDPFSHNDGDIKDLANEKLHEVFQPYKDLLFLQGIEIELLLP